MKKKGIIIGISAAVATLVIGGGALITLTTAGIIGGVAIKNGKLSLFNKGGNAGNSTGLPANATIVTPGPTGTLWDTPMEYAINVPDSIFKAADGSVIGGNTDNYTYQWFKASSSGGVGSRIVGATGKQYVVMCMLKLV